MNYRLFDVLVLLLESTWTRHTSIFNMKRHETIKTSLPLHSSNEAAAKVGNNFLGDVLFSRGRRSLSFRISNSTKKIKKNQSSCQIPGLNIRKCSNENWISPCLMWKIKRSKPVIKLCRCEQIVKKKDPSSIFRILSIFYRSMVLMDTSWNKQCWR